jgi:diguanylate cyclase (GGDEF)-like protein
VCPAAPQAVILAPARVEPDLVGSTHLYPRSSTPGQRSWLCRDDLDRERLLEMDVELRPLRRKSVLVIGVMIVASGPWVGWWPLAFVVPTGLCYGLTDILMFRSSRPEYVMLAGWLGAQVVIAVGLALVGSFALSAVAILAIPVITLGSRFPLPGIIAGVAATIGLMLAVCFGFHTREVLAEPSFVIAPVALALAVAVMSIPLMRSDIQHRSDAVIDQLTGMLNRKALSTRSEELAQQALISGDPVGMIVCDVDHFKEINDTHGHPVGDAVLKDVAYLLRKQLRAFDLAYRLGGEEFLILLPGSELERAVELAERLRERVAAEPLTGGASVTMSFGVSGSGRGEPFDYHRVFAEADAALYRAKQSGRDAVRLSETDAGDVAALA